MLNRYLLSDYPNHFHKVFESENNSYVAELPPPEKAVLVKRGCDEVID